MNRSGRTSARPLWRRPWIRAIVYQILAAAAVIALVVFFVVNVRQYLPRAGLTLGWDFLRFPARFDIDDNFVGATGRDSVWMAFLAGLTNTIAVSLIAIACCTVLAFGMALARLSSNWLLSRTALVYIETVRNIPLLLQLLFWYGLSTIFPLPRDAWNPVEGVFITNRGIFHPTLDMTPRHWLALGLLGLLLALMLAAPLSTRPHRTASGHRRWITWMLLPLVIVLPSLLFILGGRELQWSMPVLRGFNFVGGGTVSPEFVAVAVGLSVYQSGFTAETIRSGILGVRRGQVEAALSLGLKPFQALRLVIVPQALRIIIPPMTSQYLSLTKSSSLGVVVGYPELMRVTTAVISETGRAIECIAIMMSIYLLLSLLTSALMSYLDRRTAFVER